MPTFPELVTVSRVRVDDPMVNAGVVPRPFGLIEKKEVGVVVPMPTKPVLVRVKYEPVEEPTLMSGEVMAPAMAAKASDAAKTDELTNCVHQN